MFFLSRQLEKGLAGPVFLRQGCFGERETFDYIVRL